MGRKLALIAGVAAIAAPVVWAATTADAQQKVTGPVATYWMSAQTQTGFGMPTGGGASGGRQDPQAMMRAMMGGGGANRSLTLQLGSSTPQAAPSAEHLPPQVLQAGPSLPLVTPRIQPTTQAPPETPQMPREYQRPNMKILVFWGCGEHARPGQPVVLDMSKMAAGQAAGAMAAFRGLDVRPMQPPSAYRNKTYGEWPNEKTQTAVPAGGSLVGDHTIRGNYSPQINFKLEEDQDFLGALNLTTNQRAPGGWVNLGWNLVGNAGGYLATAIGGDGTTMVMWTSSETQTAAFSMPDYLSNPDISRLVASKALMSPSTRACAVPKEVLDAAPQAVAQLVAYGAEANFVYPPRPADPKAVWNQQWAVKVRYRSATGGLLGMDMASMMGGRGGGGVPGAMPPQAQQPGGRQQTPPKAPSAADILKRGILGGALPFPR